jgi:Mrp family chromosome partitioning ATPase/capsular polysaccharide biosynthesis protein
VAKASLRSPEEKLRIVLAVVRGEVTVAQAARQEGISETTIKRWRAQFLDGGLGALAQAAESSRPAQAAAPAVVADDPKAGFADPATASVLGADRREGGGAWYVEAIRQHWRLVAVIVAVAVGSAIVYSALAPKRYEAGADILVTPISSTDQSLVGFNLLQASADPTTSVLTQARLVKTPQVADAVRARLGLGTSQRALLGAVAVDPVSQANILSIVATESTAVQAARIANAFADEIIRERSELFQTQLVRRLNRLRAALPGATAAESAALQGQIAALSPLLGEPDPTLHIAARATPPYAPSSPRPVLSVLIAFFASLLLGVGVALGIEKLSPRVRSEDEILDVTSLPVLARVPRMHRKEVHEYLAGRSPLPEEAWNAYHTLRGNLAAAGPAGSFPRTILMSSAIRGEGKTMSSANLAISLAAAGTKVIAVDADLRAPMLATVFGVAPEGTGFADVFLNEAPLERALAPVTGHGGLIRLVAGSPDAGHQALLEPHRIQRGLERLKQEADVIIIDSPALTEVADALTFAAEVEAVLVVTRLGYTRPEELTEMCRMLAFRSITPTGFIVTTRRLRRAGGYYDPSRRGRAETLLRQVPGTAKARSLKADAKQGQA